MNPFFEMGVALLLDAVVGQPRWLAAAHPRRLIMMLSSFLEGVLRDRMSFELRTAGAVMAIAASTAVALAALLLSALGPVARVALMYLALSSRCLPDRAAQVDEALRRHDLSLARDRVAGMTGWDVDRMSEQDVAAAAIESLAQGAPGATVAPALYMALGLPFGVGPALGWLWVAAQALYARAGGDGWAYVDFGQFTRAL
ncbi:MAG: cobalamin biosynthesis protein, partial [Clostridiales bacterium]|nr:cobalamin biosynthesis protein [Clostridiales bacterium]